MMVTLPLGEFRLRPDNGTSRKRESVVPIIVARQNFECNADVLAQMFYERPDQWLTPFVRLACHDGEAEGLRSTPELAGSAADPKTTCVVTVGQCHYSPEGNLAFPVRWIAIGYRSVARAFSGTFELAPSGDRTLVTLAGMCKGERGRSFEMRRASRLAAEASLRSLLGNLSVAVSASRVSTRPPAAPDPSPRVQGSETQIGPRA